MNRTRMLFTGMLLALLLSFGTDVRAHCDGLDGPVIQAAIRALEKGDVNLVLVWVRKADEPELREAFNRALSVRKLGAEAKKLADTAFFETLVRVHRAGEGAPYTGLKPSGRDLGPAIPAADRALESGSEEDLVKLVTASVEKGIRERFKQARAKKNYDPGDVSAGRDYVKAYVEYIHYVERAYEAARNSAHGHFEEDAREHEEHDHK